MTTALILFSVGLNALAQVFLRHGMRNVDFSLSVDWAWRAATSFSILGGLACYAISIILWLAVMSKVQVSIAYPFQALGYVFASLMAWRWLGEGMTPLNVAGLALICCGVVILSRANG